jgi:hypothetical protein
MPVEKHARGTALMLDCRERQTGGRSLCTGDERMRLARARRAVAISRIRSENRVEWRCPCLLCPLPRNPVLTSAHRDDGTGIELDVGACTAGAHAMSGARRRYRTTDVGRARFCANVRAARARACRSPTARHGRPCSPCVAARAIQPPPAELGPQKLSDMYTWDYVLVFKARDHGAPPEPGS